MSSRAEIVAVSTALLADSAPATPAQTQPRTYVTHIFGRPLHSRWYYDAVQALL